MNDTSGPGFEDRLRAALAHRAHSMSAPADGAALAAVARGFRHRRTRRRWEAVTLTAVVVMAVGLSVAVGAGGGASPSRSAERSGTAGAHQLDRRDGVLLLPLAGSVSASMRSDEPAIHGGVMQVAPSFNGAAPGITGVAQAPTGASGPTTTAPIDVAPSASSSLQRLYAHTSPDGVQMTVFDQPAGSGGGAGSSGFAGAGSGGAAVPRGAPTGPAVTVTGPGPVGPSPQGCLTTTQLTLEISDVDAVATATEPLFAGASGALVDVQVGEIGNTEGAPATWVLAQVGAGAATVQVQFANGAIDQAAVPSSGVVVLGRKGAPADVLGNGSIAAIDVLGADGQVLAGYGLGTESSVPSGGTAPTALPAPGVVQPPDPAAATAAVTKALTAALGCSASPIQRLQFVAGGDPLETMPFAGSAEVTVDRVVFTSATAATVGFHLNAGAGGQPVGPLYAAATLQTDTWQISLASIASGIQVTPANQVGNVTVAPGGPLLVKSWPGGTAVALYKALPGSDSSPGYGTGEAACTPAGGVVEEITTPGAVGVLTAALFPNYTSALIGASVSTVGGAEGAPATVVGVEVGPQVALVSVTGNAGTVQEAPVDGEAVIVLAGDPSSALGAAGSQLQASDASGNGLATVSLQVDAAAPSGPSSLPTTLPAPGQPPADPQAATQAISAAFASVFDCSTPPIQRVQEIQDGSLVSGALEQLDTGPYEALASSSYLDVDTVVFESPTLADVAYTLRFHSDAGLTFPMVGQAVIVAGTWRVSYATICAAIQLGLGNCQA